MDPQRHRSRHVADARARLGPDNAHLYRRACAYHQDFPPRAGPRHAMASLPCRCGLAGHQRAQHARRRPTRTPHHGTAQRPCLARGRARPHAALRRQDGNTGASHRARKRRLAERHYRRRRPGKHRGCTQPPTAPDARGQTATDALCQRCEPRAAHAHRGDSGLRKHARSLGQRRPGRAGRIHRVPQGRKRAHARARGAAAVFGTRRCRAHGPAACRYQPGRTGRRGMRGIADDRYRAHVSAGVRHRACQRFALRRARRRGTREAGATRDRAKRRQVFGRGNDRHIWHNAGCGRGHDRHKC